MNRGYKYPAEYIIEALAPTTELDFDRLPAEKREIYRQIQAAHMHGSLRTVPGSSSLPAAWPRRRSSSSSGSPTRRCFARRCLPCKREKSPIGLICSEKQAIDATLASLASEDHRFTPVADQYWNARGGSHTDGGAFLLTVSPDNASRAEDLRYTMRVTDKFGDPVMTPPGQVHCDFSSRLPCSRETTVTSRPIEQAISRGKPALCSSTCALRWQDGLRPAALVCGPDRLADGRRAPQHWESRR